MDLWVVRKIHSALDLRYHVGHVLLRLQTMSSAPGQAFHDNLYIGPIHWVERTGGGDDVGDGCGV